MLGEVREKKSALPILTGSPAVSEGPFKRRDEGAGPVKVIVVLGRQRPQNGVQFVGGLAAPPQQRKQIIFLIDDVQRHIMAQEGQNLVGLVAQQDRRVADPLNQLAQLAMTIVFREQPVERFMDQFWRQRFYPGALAHRSFALCPVIGLEPIVEGGPDLVAVREGSHSAVEMGALQLEGPAGVEHQSR